MEWFLEKILGTCHVVVDCYGTPNPKCYFDLLIFHLAQGFTRPQKTPKIPKKGIKSAHTKFKYIFKEFIWNKMCSLFYLKAKMKRNSKFFKTFFRSNTILLFLKNKKILNNLWFWIIFLAIGLWCKRKVLANFQKNIFIFKAPVISLKWKFCHAWAASASGKIRWFLGIELIKI